MKRLFITLTFIAVSIANALAVNFSFTAVCSSGQTLYCNMYEQGAMVTYPNQLYASDNYYYNYTEPTGDLVIPDTVVYGGEKYPVIRVDHRAFENCKGLTSVIIPNTVTSIGFLAFCDCSNLKSVTISNAVTNISDLFINCTNLISVDIPNSVIEIGDNTFNGCSSLKTINIPNSVQTIKTAFLDCENLQYNEYDNALYLGNNENKYLWLMKAKSTSITSCEINCKHIGPNAFAGCNRMTSITIPDSVTYIGYSAFKGCSSLSFVNIPNSVTTIENDAFLGCYNLAYINIPKSVTYMGVNAINSSDITILCEPASRPGGWHYSTSYGNIEDWHSNIGTVIWNKKATITDEYVFCATDTVLRKCEIYKYIGSASDLIIPSSAYFDGVEYSVTGICDDAFDGYTFHSITLESTTPPNLSNANAFQSYIPINVPCGSLANYQSANTWSELNLKTTLKYSFEFSSADVEKGDVEVLREPTCEKSAIIQATAETGYAFEKWSDGNKSNPRYLTVTQDTALAAYFVVDEVEAEIASANTAQGTVSNSSGTYHYNDEIEISATANYGYHFARWSDGVTTNQRTVVLSKDTVIEAEFAVNQYTITLQTNNSELGSVAGGGAFNYLSNNEISASANEGYVFAKWEDGNTSNPRTVSLTCDTTFTAVFVPAEYDLTVTSANTVWGSVTGSGTIKYKEKAIISAVVTAAHYHFNGWTDGNRQNPRTVQVLSDTAFEATFAIDSFNIAATSNNEELGIVTGGGSIAYGTAVEVKALPQPHCHFVEWSNGASGTEQAFNVEKDTTITAVFAIDSHRLQVASADSVKGTVTGSGNYDYGRQVTVSATAAAGCYFTGWSDGTTANPRIITIESDTTVVANFEQMQEFGITVVPSDTARGTVSGSGKYVSGTEATLSATPRQHYLFSQWSDGRTDNPRTVRVISDATYKAVFVPEQYNVVLSQNNADMGMVSGSGVYSYGDVVSCLAKPYQNYHFVQWSNGETANPYEFVIEGNQLLTAYFAAGAVTAIEDEATAEPIIYAVGKTIVVENATDEICVYDAMGRLIGRDVARNVSTINVGKSGVYIVKTGNAVMRVVVE